MRKLEAMAPLGNKRSWGNAAAGGTVFGAMMIGGTALMGNLTISTLLINLSFAALMILFLGAVLPKIAGRKP